MVNLSKQACLPKVSSPTILCLAHQVALVDVAVAVAAVAVAAVAVVAVVAVVALLNQHKPSF